MVKRVFPSRLHCVGGQRGYGPGRPGFLRLPRPLSAKQLLSLAPDCAAASQTKATPTMVQISHTTSLLETLFALNLVAPAIFRLIDTSALTVTRAIADEVAKSTGHPRISDTEIGRLKRSVTLFYPMLRKLFGLGRILAFMSLAFTGFLLFAIAYAALDNSYQVERSVVFVVATVGIALPVSYASLSSMLGWSSRTIVDHIIDNEAYRTELVSYWQKFIETRRVSETVRREINELILRGDELRKRFSRTRKQKRDSVS